MKEEVIEFAGRLYRKVGQNEEIKEGAIHSFAGGFFYPITNSLGETVGSTPAEFSSLRVFYNPID